MEFIVTADIDKLNPPLNKKIAEQICEGQVNRFESYKDFNLISFNCLNSKIESEDYETIVVYFDKNRIVFICETALSLNYARKLHTASFKSSNDTTTLYSFFSELLRSDLDEMEDFEEEITDMENILLKENRSDYTTNIIMHRKSLLKLKRYYEQLQQVFDGVLENENKLFSEEELRLFRLLDKRTERLLSHILNLRDYITQVREAYQAQIDIEQNNLMKIFTVITAIFLPLTLIVGWYGMNFKIPEYHWDTGYLYVIVLSALTVGILIVFFRRKKWF